MGCLSLEHIKTPTLKVVHSNSATIEKSSAGVYRYGFNGYEKDDEIKGSGNHVDFVARGYDPRIGRFTSLDPLMKDNAAWSAYAFAIDNPIMYVDVNGEWPGVTFMYLEGEGGAGLSYGLNYIRQEGVAYDEVGKTQFVMTSAIYIVNQNLEEGSRNPQLALGASAGLSGAITQNWSASTFREAAGLNSASHGIPTSSPPKGKAGFKAKLGVGIGISGDDFSLSLGLQAGFKFTRLSMSVSSSISLTDDEVDKVEDATDVVLETWNLSNLAYDAEKNIWSATVSVKDMNGKMIDTGVQVFSSNVQETDDQGNVTNQSSNIWMSEAYSAEATEAEKND